jgi:hypothetical protein
VYDSSLSVNYIEVGKFTKCGVNQMWILKTSKDLYKYVVNQTKHEHVDDISFRELFGRIRVGFFFKIIYDLSLPNTRSLYLR